MSTKKKPRNPDHVRSRRMSAPTQEQIEEHLGLLIKPAVYSQLACYRLLGLRERILSLPLMVAALLTMMTQEMRNALRRKGLKPALQKALAAARTY